MATMSSMFLDLPLELRLIIYGFAVIDSPTVVISSTQLTGKCPDIIDRLYGAKRSPLAGLPVHHEPVILPTYNSELLSAAEPASINVSQKHAPVPKPYLDTTYHSTLTSLLLCNAQVNAEVESYFQSKSNRKTSLFVSYPHGLHVFQTLCPDYVRQARSIHIAGTYKSTRPQITTRKSKTNTSAEATSSSAATDKSDPATTTTPDYTAALTRLVRATMGKSPKFPLTKLELRMYFPGQDSYSSVWGDENSPICVVLRNVCAGHIDIECSRGRYGTGVYLTVRPNPEGGRVISTIWRRLVEGDSGQPKCGDWIVDKKWPVWEEKYTPSPPSTPMFEV